MNHGWQSEATDGPKGGWGLLSFSLFLSLSLSFSLFLSLSLSFSLFLSLSLSFSFFLSLSLSFSTYLPTYRPTDRPTYLSIYLSIYLSFDPPEPRTWIFFLLRLSLFWSSFFFSSLLFSDSSHLCFSFVHIVGSLTSKLPSISNSMVYLCMYMLAFNYVNMQQVIVQWTNKSWVMCCLINHDFDHFF